MFITFLSSENKANDQKKLKKMVEELANKYGKTEDEIFYAYDQWVFFLLKQKSFFFFLFLGGGKNINSDLQIYVLRFMEKYPTGVISKKQFSDEMGVSIRMPKIFC